MTRRTRLVLRLLAALGIAGALLMPFAIRRPVQGSADRAVDGRTVVETINGRLVRISRGHEDVRIDFDRQMTFPGGSTRFAGVRMTTADADGRTLTLTAHEAAIAADESSVGLSGNVRMATNDGLAARTERATHEEADGLVRAPGAVQFSYRRIAGSSVGMTYDTNARVVTMLDRVRMSVPSDGGGRSATVTSAAATFDTSARVIRFSGGMRVEQGARVLRADNAAVHVNGDERVDLIELEGHAGLEVAAAKAGGLESLEGQRIQLRYAVDGRSLEQAVITGDALMRVAGGPGSVGSRLTANTLHARFAAGAPNPTRLEARDSVELTIASENDRAPRVIRASALDAEGTPDEAISSARLSGGVAYRERSGDAERRIRSGMLAVRLAPGAGIERASFAGDAAFEAAPLKGNAAAIVYDTGSGTLSLGGTDVAGRMPHLSDESISIDASSIDIRLNARQVRAKGKVRTALAGVALGRTGGGASQTDRARPVNVVANNLDYDGTASLVVYAGDAQLWAAATSIRAERIEIAANTGNLSASGTVTTTMMLPGDRGHAGEPVRSVTTAGRFAYDDALRRATYSDGARMAGGAAGELSAGRIDVYFETSGGEVVRIEGDEDVTLRAPNRTLIAGRRFTYTLATGRYAIVGSPVNIVDGCGSRTVASTFVYDKPTNTTVIDGGTSRTSTTVGWDTAQWLPLACSAPGADVRTRD